MVLLESSSSGATYARLSVTASLTSLAVDVAAGGANSFDK